MERCVIFWHYWSGLSSAGLLCACRQNQLVRRSCIDTTGVVLQPPFYIPRRTTLTIEGTGLNSNTGLRGEALLRICPRARTPLRRGTSMICHAQLGTTAGINELEVPVEMQMVQRILLVEGNRMYRSRRELLVSFVGKEN